MRYYLRPEETHLGRQRHHGARELFLARQRMYEPIDALLRRAFVRSPLSFLEASHDDEEEEGNDVYVCEYEYDEGWKRFKRRAYAGEGGGGAGARGEGADGDDWALGGGSGGSDGSDEDEEDEEDGSGGSDEAGEGYRPERVARGGGGGRRKKHGTLQLPGGEEDRVRGRMGRGISGVGWGWLGGWVTGCMVWQRVGEMIG